MEAKAFSVLTFFLLGVTLAHAEWHLVWSDEFNGNHLNETEWVYDVGFTTNNEQQCYTANRTENVRVESGHLVLYFCK